MNEGEGRRGEAWGAGSGEAGMPDDPHQPPALRGTRPLLTNTERFFPGPGRHEHLSSDYCTNITVTVMRF